MSYSIRPCRARDELAACVRLQKEIWGYSDLEVYPLRLFVNLRMIGGHVLGAFSPRGEVVGFVASLPAWRDGRRYYQSLSLGVLPEYANCALGRALKMAQRRAALRAGVEWIEWTFDPLQAKNAYFNLMRLGAVVRPYLGDHYGVVDSRLQAGLPSDRLGAEWWLMSERVRRALWVQSPRPRGVEPAAEAAIPCDISLPAQADFGRAQAEQRRVREELLKCSARRLVITGFELRENAGVYLLDRSSAGVSLASTPPGRRRYRDDNHAH